MQSCPHGSKLLGDSFAIELRQAANLHIEHHGRLRLGEPEPGHKITLGLPLIGAASDERDQFVAAVQRRRKSRQQLQAFAILRNRA